MTRSHRRILSAAAPAVLLAVLVTGCGSDDGEPDVRGEESSQTASSDPSSTDSSPAPGAVDFEEVAILHETAAGGSTEEPGPVVLDSKDAVDGFVGQFTRGDLGKQVRDEVDATDVPDGKVLVGSVIALGCDVPPGVTVSTGDEGLQIVGQKVPSPMQECYAPVTTVALVLVDADAVG